MLDKVEPIDKLLLDITNTLEMIDMGDDSLLDDINAEYENLVPKFKTIEIKNLFSGQFDTNNAYITINAGAGGTESCDWVAMLTRMYSRFCEKKGFSIEIVDELAGDEAGIKQINMYIQGDYAYGYLRSEIGVHRLVRISPFDSNARRHTSFAAVSIMPEVDENIEVDINTADLRIDTYRASGAGGQHVNKTSSAIRITHLPTNTVVQCQAERSQHQNKDRAMSMLKAKLYQLERIKLNEKKDAIAGEKTDIAWGNQIRSYVFQPYQMVKDLRTSCESGNVSAVMDGEIEDFIVAYLNYSLLKK